MGMLLLLLKKLLSFALVVFLVTPQLLVAQVMTSTSYQLRFDSANSGGGLATSTSYQLEDTLGETATGKSSSSSPWYNASWQHRIKLTIPASSVDGALTDFPVYVDLSDLPTSFFEEVQSDGDDIRVTTSDGVTEVPIEVVSITTSGEPACSSNCTGELHFKAPSLDPSSPNDFYIYFGNSGASGYGVSDTYGRNNVWTNGFVYVNHMESTTGADSVGNAGSSTAGGSPSTSTGKLSGNAIDFNGSTDYLEHGDFAELDGMSDLVFSAWMNSDSFASSTQLLSQSSSSNSDRNIWIGVSASNGLFSYASADGGGSNDGQLREGGTTSISTSSWQHVYSDINLTSESGKMYVNNVSQSFVSKQEDGSGFPDSTRNSAENFRVAGRNDGLNDFDGDLDEVRLASTARSTDWISAEYTNQNTPSSFYTVSHRETDWSDWGYRIKLTIDSGEVDSTLTDFPVYVDLSDLPSDFWTNLGQSDGDDIRVAKGDGEEMPFELVTITDSGSSGTGELHFKADSISSSTDTDFYIYYGNGSTAGYGVSDTYGRNNVWSDYDAVFHFQDADPSTTITDSTGNGYGMTDTGLSSSSDVAGQLGSSLELSTTTYAKYTEGSASVPQTAPITMQTWFKPDDNTNTYQLAFIGNDGSSFEFAGIQGRTDSTIRVFKHTYGGSSVESVYTTANYSGGAWNMVHGVWTSSELKVYLNGGNKVTETDNTTNSFNNHDSLGIGRMHDSTPGNSSGDHDQDEYRVRSSEFSDDWISAEYTNQNTPTTFYSVSSEESVGGSYVLGAGYQQMNEEFLSISTINDVVLQPGISVSVDNSVGSETFTVQSDNAAGYNLYIRTTQSTALQHLAAGSDFLDYTPATPGTPDNWSVDSGQKQFGYSVYDGGSGDVSDGTWGSADDCGSVITGDPDAPGGGEQLYDGLSTSNRLIASRSSRTVSGGSSITVCFAAGTNNDAVDAGSYQAPIVITAVAL